MPIFALILGFIPALFANFLAMFTRKYTVAVASVLAFIATTITFIVCMKSIIGLAVSLIIMPAWIYNAIAWLIPSNFISITSAIISGKICKSAYVVVTEKIKLINSAS